MTPAQAAIAIDTVSNEEPEIKRSIRLTPVATRHLTEWELARETSKTWSMEQD
ncbi:MAG: hypothetical protein ISP92_06620 [Pseudomonadales bacterium]|jgi:hypothetical protein|nr:hypothetical protein [Pseudomonadales bacterium]MDA0761453.1 hypothetical protein [Pseudomonadota bacterium]MDA0957822.1 hypothetical protein [Pseudomonadota bacterium]MDA1206453.1 hypothetical protein [Pseudomonadota bacterium]